jgi:hypothetical protein
VARGNVKRFGHAAICLLSDFEADRGLELTRKHCLDVIHRFPSFKRKQAISIKYREVTIVMRFCSPEAPAECARNAAEYKAKAETAVALSERQSFAEIAKRFVAMARGCEALDHFEPGPGGQAAAPAWRLN